MNEYRIGAIAKLTGLSVHNLRAWEKRHQAFTTERTDSGRRIYTEKTLQRLKLLKACVDNGMAISTIAKLKDEDLHSTLAQYSNREPLPQSNPALRVITAGVNLPSYLTNNIAEEVSINLIRSCTNLEDVTNQYNQEKLDVLLLEIPAISAQEARQLGSSIKAIHSRQKILIYRYARQQDIAFLRTLGVTTLKAPIDKAELISLFKRLSKPTLVQRSFTPDINKIPQRLYNDSEINKAANLSSSIDCECPQHMAEIIKGLLAFESYSSQCESKDKAGADLHRFIHQRTAHARAIMEDLLQSVLQQEGIDLQLIAV